MLRRLVGWRGRGLGARRRGLGRRLTGRCCRLRGGLGRLRVGVIGGLGPWLRRFWRARYRRVARHLRKGRAPVSENRALSDNWLSGPIRSLNHVRYLTLLGGCRIRTPGLVTRSIRRVL